VQIDTNSENLLNKKRINEDDEDKNYNITNKKQKSGIYSNEIIKEIQEKKEVNLIENETSKAISTESNNLYY